MVLGLGVPPKPDFWLHEGTPRSRTSTSRSAPTTARWSTRSTGAIAAGGKDNGPPGLRPHYHRTTTARSCSTPTATTSRPAATPTAPGKVARGGTWRRAVVVSICVRRNIRLGVAIATILVGAYPAAARPVVRPCRPGTPEHKQAAARLEEVSAAILGLAPAEDPKPAIDKLEALGRLACFEIVGELSVEAKSGLALKSWWESGGHSHAASALDLGGRRPTVWAPPTCAAR